MATYAKTVQCQLPPTWRLPAGCEAIHRQYQAPEYGGWIPGLDVWNQNLSRAEILLNRFALQISDRRQPRELWHQCFRQGRAYRTALATLSRTLMGLYRKDLIEWPDCFVSVSRQSWQQWDGVRLTPLGVAAAQKLSEG